MKRRTFVTGLLSTTAAIAIPKLPETSRITTNIRGAFDVHGGGIKVEYISYDFSKEAYALRDPSGNLTGWIHSKENALMGTHQAGRSHEA